MLNIDPSREFGFLEGEDGREIYFHTNSVLGDEMKKLRPGVRVSFHKERGEKGPRASIVRML